MRVPLCVFLLILVLTSPAKARRSEYILGGDTGNLWPAALSEAPGFYVVFDAGGQPIDSVAVGIAPRETGVDTLIDYSNGAIRPVWIDPNENLARRLDLADGQITSSEPLGYREGQLQSIRLSFDGDPKTATFRTMVQDPLGALGIGLGEIASCQGTSCPARPWRENIIVDFGANLPINRIRFFPRLGDDDALLIEQIADPKPDRNAFGTESFSANFLEWYEIGVADNSAPLVSSGTPPPGKRAFKSTRLYRSTNDPAFTILRQTTENLDVVVDFRFPLRHERWVAIRAFNPLRDWEIAEFEVYGEGYVRKAVYLTHILDFGHPVSWGKIRWAGEFPPDTGVKIRTRTGNDPDPDIFWKKNSITGDLEEITFGTYKLLPVNTRQPPIYDTDNWSFWSPPYDFEAGLRDLTRAADAWKDGIPLLSPSPSRYLQFHVALYSTRNEAPQLQALWLQFAQSPSASQIVGEIWPIDVVSFEPQTFTYVVKPEFQEGDAGFDRLEILTYTTADTVRSVKVNGPEIDLEAFPPEILSDRIIVALPKLQDAEEDSRKQVEVSFDAAVLRFGAEFKGWVFNSDDPSRLKQQVEPGNATFRYAGDGLSVRTVVGGDLLVFVETSPNPFTPNGDGINDELSLSFKVREVAVQRSIQMKIYDLSGQLVRELTDEAAKTGAYLKTWDGRDDREERVSPGIYIYRISLEADERREEKVGTIAVVY